MRTTASRATGAVPSALQSLDLPSPLSEGDIYEACRAFILDYVRPPLDAAHVIQGWQNRTSLPQNSNDYAVISVCSAVQQGSSVERLEFDGELEPGVPRGVLSVHGLMDVSVQAEFYSETDVSRQRAQRIAILFASSVGAHFFRERDLNPLYAEDVREFSDIGDANQFVRRYSVTLHLSCWAGEVVEQQYFDKARLSRFEDVDVHHHIL